MPSIVVAREIEMADDYLRQRGTDAAGDEGPNGSGRWRPTLACTSAHDLSGGAHQRYLTQAGDNEWPQKVWLIATFMTAVNDRTAQSHRRGHHCITRILSGEVEAMGDEDEQSGYRAELAKAGCRERFELPRPCQETRARCRVALVMFCFAPRLR